MNYKKLFLSAATGCLLLGASGAMAIISDVVWYNVKLESVSGKATANSQFCIGAYQELLTQGYTLAASGDPDPGITVFVFKNGMGDVAALYCAAEYVFEVQ